MTALPSPNKFLSSLFSSPLFPVAPSCTIPNTPSVPIASAKPLLLTLHCLFPSELLSALHLLDKRLVTRFIFTSEGETVVDSPRISTLQDDGRPVVYYVRSSQPARLNAAARHDSVGMNYEVRTRAGNCTCPAFTLASFADEGLRELDLKTDEKSGDDPDRPAREEWMRNDERVGGLALGNDFYVCKHLLACVLVERCEGLEEYVETRLAGRAETAGWAAGWGG